VSSASTAELEPLLRLLNGILYWHRELLRSLPPPPALLTRRDVDIGVLREAAWVVIRYALPTVLQDWPVASWGRTRDGRCWLRYKWRRIIMMFELEPREYELLRLYAKHTTYTGPVLLVKEVRKRTGVRADTMRAFYGMLLFTQPIKQSMYMFSINQLRVLLMGLKYMDVEEDLLPRPWRRPVAELAEEAEE